MYLFYDDFVAALYNTVPRPAATLDMFPSWPMRVHQTSRVVLFYLNNSSLTISLCHFFILIISKKSIFNFNLSQQVIPFLDSNQTF